MRIADRIYWVGSGCVGISAPGDCHTYLIEGDDALALVDCGMAADPRAILEEIRRDGLDPDRLRYCFLTHAHYDHAGGCRALQAQGVRIVGSPAADQVLRRGAAEYYGLQGSGEWIDNWRGMPLCCLDDTAGDGSSFDLGGVTVRAIATPGHSPDSMCYLAAYADSGRRNLFSGDTVFYKGFISVLHPALSDLRHYPEGIHALAGLGVDGLFPGHLMWVLEGGQQYIDIADRAFQAGQVPDNKPFS